MARREVVSLRAAGDEMAGTVARLRAADAEAAPARSASAVAAGRRRTPVLAPFAALLTVQVSWYQTLVQGMQLVIGVVVRL
ncbi:MAG: hypothetical protein GEV03_28105 [Streptosporangiales bacterium]|nr:hypothetical protein [Streptosporangiales bacterium]